MNMITDEEFLAASPQEQIEYAAGIARGMPDEITDEGMAAMTDLHGKIRQLDPQQRQAFMAGLAWETKQSADRELGQ
jgi:hypothetical protein